MNATQNRKQTRMIYCPGPERWVSIKAYVAGIRKAKTHLDAEFKQGITCWWPCTGRDIIKQFAQGLHDRINQGISYSQRGACFDA